MSRILGAAALRVSRATFLARRAFSSREATATTEARASTTDRKRRNILFITTDQQRWDSLGSNGNRFCRTPNIDALARAGINYTRAYNQNTVCMPATSGPGRSSALEATRSSNRSHFMARSVSVASGDSNWKTPAVRPSRSSAYTAGSS